MKKILIIEDDALLSKILQLKLQQGGTYEVVRAYDGESGLALVAQHHPDFVVLDLAMPKKSGFEVLEELHKDGAPKFFVLVLTNLGSEADKQRALALGSNDYFIKADVKINDVVDYIAKKLS